MPETETGETEQAARAASRAAESPPMRGKLLLAVAPNLDKV